MGGLWSKKKNGGEDNFVIGTPDYSSFQKVTDVSMIKDYLPAAATTNQPKKAEDVPQPPVTVPLPPQPNEEKTPEDESKDVRDSDSSEALSEPEASEE
jgi:hypothetical protein